MRVLYMYDVSYDAYCSVRSVLYYVFALGFCPWLVIASVSYATPFVYVSHSELGPHAGVSSDHPIYYVFVLANLGSYAPSMLPQVFMLPWLEATIAGTTDAACPVTMRPRATREEVDFILDAIQDYLKVQA
eukprot:2120650-Pyramimonas_sp.AAC.1